MILEFHYRLSFLELLREILRLTHSSIYMSLDKQNYFHFIRNIYFLILLKNLISDKHRTIHKQSNNVGRKFRLQL